MSTKYDNNVAHETDSPRAPPQPPPPPLSFYCINRSRPCCPSLASRYAFSRPSRYPKIVTIDPSAFHRQYVPLTDPNLPPLSPFHFNPSVPYVEPPEDPALASIPRQERNRENFRRIHILRLPRHSLTTTEMTYRMRQNYAFIFSLLDDINKCIADKKKFHSHPNGQYFYLFFIPPPPAVCVLVRPRRCKGYGCFPRAQRSCSRLPRPRRPLFSRFPSLALVISRKR